MLFLKRCAPATNIFVYWSDGLGDWPFDHHNRNGDGAFDHHNRNGDWAFDHHNRNGDGAFDHHNRNGDGAFVNRDCLLGRAFDNIFFKCLGLPQGLSGGMLAAEIDSHINSGLEVK